MPGINARRGLLLILFTAAVSGCTQSNVRSHSHEMLNATLWQQSSGEYQAVARQTYYVAQSRLDQALADPQWTAAVEQNGDYQSLPPAIVVDIDETILDNTPYETKIIKELGQYSPESFADWCRSENAPTVPGSLEFLTYASKRGVAVFYYSSRREHLRECTARNLRDKAFPFNVPERLLLNGGETKSRHRSDIAKDYRILLLVGDNLEDFIEGSKSSPTDRRMLVNNYQERWGKQWIILPNPMYGHWEASTYNFDYRLPRNNQLDFKLNELN